MRATPNEHGVRWATSRSGRYDIAVGPDGDGGYRVWALYRGTHDLAPYSRNFADEAAANAYANRIWAG